jgi:hypothetical protein
MGPFISKLSNHRFMFKDQLVRMLAPKAVHVKTLDENMLVVDNCWLSKVFDTQQLRVRGVCCKVFSR